MSIHPQRNYANRRTAEQIVEEANKLTTGARWFYELAKLEENDKKRGVGAHRVVIQVQGQIDYYAITSRANTVLDLAERRALATELSKYAPGHHLCGNYWLKPESDLQRVDFSKQ
jgi:hypothetical protein